MNLFWAELRRIWTLFLRYPSEAIGQIFGVTVLFYGLFLGIGYVAGPGGQFGARLEALVVGYVLWSLVVYAMSSLTWNLQNEAQMGTLEQLFLSPFGAGRVIATRALADLVLNLGINFIILVLILLLTGTRLYLSAGVLLPLIAALLGAYGLAFAVGGLVLLFKRAQQLVGMLQFFLVFLVMAPLESLSGPLAALQWFLPIAPGAGIMRGMMAQGQPLEALSLGAAFLNGLIFLAIGLLIFRWAARRVRYLGSLGGY